MRYFACSRPLTDIDSTTETHVTITYSEDDIRRIYYPEWYQSMCNTYGQEIVDRYYTFEHCLRDWKYITWATEIPSSDS